MAKTIRQILETLAQEGHIKYSENERYKDNVELAEAEIKALMDEERTLLERCSDLFDEMDSLTWYDDSDWQHSSYGELQDDVNEFLNK